MTQLAHLTELKFSTANRTYDDCITLDLQVHWRQMKQLCLLPFSNCWLTTGRLVYSEPDKLLMNTTTDLMCAPRLSSLHFDHCRIPSRSSLDLTLMLCCLCATCPSLHIVVDGTQFSEALKQHRLTFLPPDHAGRH